MAASDKQSGIGLFIAILVLVLTGSILFFISRPGVTPPLQHNPPDMCPTGQECPLKKGTALSKDNLSPAQQKVSSDLLQLTGSIGLPEGQTLDGLEQQMEQNHQLIWVDDNGQKTQNKKTGHPVVYVYIQTTTKTDAGFINAYVWNVTNTDPENRLIVAWVDVDNLPAISSLDSVQSIRMVTPPVTRVITR